MNDITIWRPSARFERCYAAIVIAVVRHLGGPTSDAAGARLPLRAPVSAWWTPAPEADHRPRKVGKMPDNGWHLGAARCTPLSDY
jgi:hypothetical protein